LKSILTFHVEGNFLIYDNYYLKVFKLIYNLKNAAPNNISLSIISSNKMKLSGSKIESTAFTGAKAEAIHVRSRGDRGATSLFPNKEGYGNGCHRILKFLA